METGTLSKAKADQNTQTPDYIVVGGGVVGLAVAYGLLQRGLQVTCIDGGDGDFRASRGNFGLVWVQGKGLDAPHYARWTQDSATLYPAYVDQLQRHTDLDIGLQQNGGMEHFTCANELQAYVRELEQIAESLDTPYLYQVLNLQQAQQREPLLGNDVVGSVYFPQDGHLNPLVLLRALAQRCTQLGLQHVLNEQVVSIEKDPNDIDNDRQGYQVKTKSGKCFSAPKIVLATGLDPQDLLKQTGFKVKLHPQRGQLLITEKLPPCLNYPSITARQTNDGSIQIGATHDEVGLNNDTDIGQLAQLAQQATKVFPNLAAVRWVRAWGALRILTEDGMPVYEKSQQYPGISLVSCHSGISLAPMHSGVLVDWLLDDKVNKQVENFSAQRFY